MWGCPNWAVSEWSPTCVTEVPNSLVLARLRVKILGVGYMSGLSWVVRRPTISPSWPR